MKRWESLGGLTRILRRTYFPLAFLIVTILIVFDVGAPPVVGQVRTVTVTQTVRGVVTVTVTQQVYVTLERTAMVTVATGIPTTFTSVMTSVVSRLATETSLVSRLVTETVSVQAPIQVGPFSLDLTDAGGLRFLGYTAGVALAGLVSGALASRLGFRHRKPAIIEPGPQFDHTITRPQFEPRPPDDNSIIPATYGTGAVNSFAQKGIWDFIPDGTLQQIDQNGNRITVRESGEVTIHDKTGQLAFKQVDPAAERFFKTMKISKEMREKTGT